MTIKKKAVCFKCDTPKVVYAVDISHNLKYRGKLYYDLTETLLKKGYVHQDCSFRLQSSGTT